MSYFLSKFSPTRKGRRRDYDLNMKNVPMLYQKYYNAEIKFASDLQLCFLLSFSA